MPTTPTLDPNAPIAIDRTIAKIISGAMLTLATLPKDRQAGVLEMIANALGRNATE